MPKNRQGAAKGMTLISGRLQLWILSLVGLTVIALVGGLAFYRPFDPTAQAGETPQAVPAAPLPAPPPLPGRRITFLVMGVDKRPDDTGRSDSLVVLSYDQATQQVAMLSLPRDTWAEIPGHGYDKINHAYAYGGDSLAVSAVRNLLGVPIDHFVTISFQGFAHIVDALGGVDVDAEKRMEYKDPFDTGMGPDGLVIDIQPGPQHMDGTTALKYSRFRMDAEGDFGRMRRQQQVAKAMLKAAAQPAVVTRIPQLISALGDAIETDLSVAEMVKLATGARAAFGQPLKTGSLSGEPRTIGGIYYLVPDLIRERLTAYEILAGQSAPEAFAKRAVDDQATFGAAVTEAARAADAATAATAQGGGAATSAGASAGGSNGPGGSGSAGAGGAGAPGGPGAPGAGGPGKPSAKPLPVTVALFDGTGRNLGATYAAKLKAAGFRVARISKLPKPVAQTAAVDHAGQPGTGERIRGVLPTALLVSAPDSRAEAAMDIVLGQDLVGKP